MNKPLISFFLFVFTSGLFYVSMHADTYVRFGKQLCTDEYAYLRERSAVTHKACEALLHESVQPKAVPRVALCFSGGGMRAAILSLGCLRAAQDTGLLDCCTYVASLSGSTWSVAASTALTGIYTDSDHASPDQALSDYCTLLRENLNVRDLNALVTEERAQELWDYLKHRIFSFHTLSAAELYGYFLTMLLMPKLNENRFTATLSQTHAFIKNGTVPMPIYTALEASGSSYRWVEFTPFEMGIAEDINAYIPMNGFGNNFVNGTGVGYEKTVGYCLATFGSAFAVNLHDLILHMSDALLSKVSAPYVVKCAVRSMLEIAINKFYESHEDSQFAALTKQHFMAAHVPNYCYDIAGNPLSSLKTLTLIDGGIGFHNLPLIPLLNPERHVDVIIIYDASEHVQGAPALADAELYAHDHGMPFPVIDYEDIERRPISVFEGEDAKTPTIIYMPRFATEVSTRTVDPKTCLADGSCSTFRFRYDPEAFDDLFNVSYNAFKKQVHVYKRVIQDRLISRTT